MFLTQKMKRSAKRGRTWEEQNMPRQSLAAAFSALGWDVGLGWGEAVSPDL